MTGERLLNQCPNGCRVELAVSALVVAEGRLAECPACGQLLSTCSRAVYEQSGLAWNTAAGTWPSPKDYRRLLKRRSQDIRIIAGLLAKEYAEIRLLDVGCSNGSFVAIAQDLGVQAEGVDPSPEAVQDGLRRGLKLHAGFLVEVGLPDGSFDAITLHEVLEHVAEPIALLQECRRILKPGGIVLIGTGNIDSWTRQVRGQRWDFFDMHQHGGHISFFSPRSLGVLAAATGFTVAKVITHAVKFSERDELPLPLYRAVKLLTEALNLPARLMGKGHQMEVYLRAG